MKIDEAIEILKDKMGLGKRYDDDDLDEATRLGVEALKHIKYLRSQLFVLSTNLLPSEHGDYKRGK